MIAFFISTSVSQKVFKMKQVFLVLLVVVLGCVHDSEELSPPAPSTCDPCPADKFGSIYYIQNKDTCECVQRFCIRYRCAAQSTSVKCKDTPCLCCGPRRTTTRKTTTTTTTTTTTPPPSSERNSSEGKSDENNSDY
jgi:hypothetical protein